MNTLEYSRLDRRHLWHPYTKHSSIEREHLPLIVRGDGVYLFDNDGRRYIDAIASWWSCNLGHNHPRLINAITRQAGELQHSILGGLSHPRAVELAAGLAGLFPDNSRRVLFACDGAGAVEAAIKIAVQYWRNIGRPEKNKFSSLEGAYHGDTLGAVSVGYIESFHKQFQSLLFPALRAESPCCGTCAYGKEPDGCSLECFASMERIFSDHARELAAVIVEPMCQGAGGMRIYSPKYLRRLAERCGETDVLLIADEIAVGFGRTGRMFAFEHAGVAPDIVCLGKGLSGGYLPISATVVKHEIYRTFGDTPEDHTFYHGHTFAGNPIAAAVALETLRIYEEEKIVGHAAETGTALRALMSGFRKMKHVVDVRCLGMIAAVELGRYPGDAAGSVLAQEVKRKLFEEGILLRPLDNVVYLMPPLTISRDTLDFLVEQMYDSIGNH